MLWQQTTAPAMTFSYDALGRRVSLDNPQTFYFHDGMDVIRSIVNPQAGQTVSDFARLPGGEVVASSVSGGAQAGTRIALHDIAGSTIALVNPSTGAVETQYTYDPAGVVGMAGASSTFPFLFQGMEYDVPTGLYHTGNNYYSPQLTRPVSEVGPTPGRTSGNPSSPADVPGFGGGGGSFAWTYNNLQPQLSASMAAGAGAAGLTAGAAALVSTLGLDIGLTVSAAGPVGAVVGALTGLGFLFADLFGGGPDIPRELRLPAHSLLGMEQFAGQADVVDQKAARGDSPLAGGIIRVVDITLPGTNYCGPGNKGGTPQRNTLDQCCREHDAAYSKDGLNALNVPDRFFGGISGYFPSKEQLEDDQALCDCAKRLPPSEGRVERLIVMGIFCL
jgi:hypothetical protein